MHYTYIHSFSMHTTELLYSKKVRFGSDWVDRDIKEENKKLVLKFHAIFY